MPNEIMRHFNLAKEFRQAGYFETEHLREIVRDVKGDIKLGKLIAISGAVGSGKTIFLKRLKNELEREKEILVARSLALDKGQVTIFRSHAGAIHGFNRQREGQGDKGPGAIRKTNPQTPGNHPEIEEDSRPFCGRSARPPWAHLKRLEATDGGRPGIWT